MSFFILNGCWAAATWEQQVFCSSASGNAGTNNPYRNRFADGLHHRRMDILSTLLHRHCVRRERIFTHDLWECGILAKQNQNRDRTYSLPLIPQQKPKSP